jgi:hypothetical protein
MRHPVLGAPLGGEGHQLVALIAEDHLTPSARAAVKDLLDGANISDAEVANWADEIRRERPETSAWHYVNIPVDDPKGFNRARGVERLKNRQTFAGYHCGVRRRLFNLAAAVSLLCSSRR